MQDLDATGIGREPGDADEIELDGNLSDRASRVGHEQEGALENADQHDAVGVIALDLATEPVDVGGEGVGVEQDLRGHVSP